MRLAAKAALACEMNDLAESVGPHQMAVGTRAGAEAAPHRDELHRVGCGLGVRRGLTMAIIDVIHHVMA